MPNPRPRRLPAAVLIVLMTIGMLSSLSIILMETPSCKQSTTSAMDSAKTPKATRHGLFVPSEPDQWKRDLLARLDRILQVCGDLCSVVDQASWEMRLVKTPQSLSNFPMISIPNVDCPAIIGNADMDAGDSTFPEEVPNELLPFYTLNGWIDFRITKIFKNAYMDTDALSKVWTEEGIEADIKAAMATPTTLHGSYGPEGTSRVLSRLRQVDLSNRSVLVIGSERPWLEAICLGLGAANVTTLEYGSIQSHHAKIRTLTPHEFRMRYQDGTLGTFDVVISHSSLEHSGLGRYGDALMPWGDILAMARAWCVTKTGGKLFLGLPTGKDTVLFNMHRVYGKIRWPLVTANWQQIDGANHGKEEFLVNTTKRIFGGTGFLFSKVEYT